MEENDTLKRATGRGHFVGKPLGKGKASKFLAVEGMNLTPESRQVMSGFEIQGLKGDALRAAISGAFARKRS